MTARPGRVDTETVLLRHKRSLDSIRKDNRRTSRRVDAGRDGYLVSVSGVPGDSGTPAVLGSPTLPAGSWNVWVFAYGDYDDIQVALSSPNVGWEIAHRTLGGSVIAGGSARTSATYSEPTVVDVSALVATATAELVVVDLELTPR